MTGADAFPRMFLVRQKFPDAASLDIAEVVRQEFHQAQIKLKPGSTIAVAVGSRGISNLQQIVREVVRTVQNAKAHPFIVPAMGSHGGATPEGQVELLDEYGITERELGVPLRPAMDVEQIGETADAVPVYLSREALRADGIVIVNRVKPHTDFSGSIGSGILKMMVVGLGKRIGAANYHLSAARLGYEHVLRTAARVIIQQAPILCGVAVVENQRHATARLSVLQAEEFEKREEELFTEARALMPRLPFPDIDLLIVDRIGKNISGAGLDPNVIGRSVHGYSSLLGEASRQKPAIRRLFVRELTPETHGNAIGIGMADLTTSRLVRSINHQITSVNALTALTPQGAKIPIHFESDREAIGRALESVGAPDMRRAKIVRIADTLSLEYTEVSEAYATETAAREDLLVEDSGETMRFDEAGNLVTLRGAGKTGSQ